MQNYELTIVLPEKATEAKKKSAKKLIEKLINTYEGGLGEMEDWGSKDFYYEIDGETTGVFLHFPIQLNKDKVNPFRENLRMQEEIIRYLLVKSKLEEDTKE